MKKENAIFVGITSVLGVVWIRAYGQYQYSKGRHDSNELCKIIIDSQHETIVKLCEKLKQKEKES